MIRRLLIVFALMTVAFAGSQMVHTQTAQALELQAGIGPRIGGATITDEDLDEDNNSSTGIGFGIKGWVALKFIDFLAVGVNFDYAHSFHTLETDFGDIDLTASAPSFGVILRSELADMIALDIWVNYAFGTLTAEVGNISTDVDESGVHLGIDAMYRIQIGAYKTWIEVGPYFTFGSFTDTDDNVTDDNATTYLSYGLVVQAAFEFGL